MKDTWGIIRSVYTHFSQPQPQVIRLFTWEFHPLLLGRLEGQWPSCTCCCSNAFNAQQSIRQSATVRPVCSEPLLPGTVYKRQDHPTLTVRWDPPVLTQSELCYRNLLYPLSVHRQEWIKLRCGTLLYSKCITNKDLCTAQGTRLKLCGSLDGRRVWERMDTSIGMAESLGCSPETTTTLLIDYRS